MRQTPRGHGSDQVSAEKACEAATDVPESRPPFAQDQTATGHHEALSTDSAPPHGVGVSQRAAFRWPPRPIDPDRIDRALNEGRPGLVPPASHASPATVRHSAGAIPHRRPAPAPDARPWLASVLEQFERVFLDPVSPGWAVRTREAGWAPDESEEYCARCGHGRPGHASSSDHASSRAVPGLPAQCPICAEASSARPAFDRVVRLGAYTAPLDDWIREVKFGAFAELGRDLGRELGARVSQALQAEGHRGRPVPSRVIIVPVPTSRRRRLARGIDHTMALARGVRDALAADGWIVQIRRLLSRRHRPSQLEVPASERERNARGSIVPARSLTARCPWFGAWAGMQGLADGGLFLVVDDVLTTGATMRTASRALRRGLLEVGVLSPKPNPGGVQGVQGSTVQANGGRTRRGRKEWVVSSGIWAGLLGVTERAEQDRFGNQ